MKAVEQPGGWQKESKLWAVLEIEVSMSAAQYSAAHTFGSKVGIALTLKLQNSRQMAEGVNFREWVS